MILHLVENKTDIQNKIKNEKKNNKETDELRAKAENETMQKIKHMQEDSDKRIEELKKNPEKIKQLKELLVALEE